MHLFINIGISCIQGSIQEAHIIQELHGRAEHRVYLLQIIHSDSQGKDNAMEDLSACQRLSSGAENIPY